VETGKSAYSFSNAITDLQSAGIRAKDEAFGFSVALQDLDTNYRLECGYEHDGNISLSVASGKSVVRWFFRQTVREMVEFLFMANELMKSEQVDNWAVVLDKVENQ